jgi:hypothetical protein
MHPGPVLVNKHIPEIVTQEEASTEAMYQVVPAAAIDTISVDTMRNQVPDHKMEIHAKIGSNQKEHADSAGIGKQDKQASATTMNGRQTAFLVSGVLFAFAIAFIVLGIATTASPPNEAGISPFLLLGALLLFFFVIAFLVALIMWAIYEGKHPPLPKK